MPQQLGDKFRSRIEKAQAALQGVREEKASQKYPGGEWTRKQVIGHLLDSAANNHIRFVAASLDGKYTGPKYDADGWVRLHDYANLSWSYLFEQWRDRNSILAHVVDHVPEEALNAQCIIGDDQPVTLRVVIEDYLDHLEHHVSDILS
jgi:hypothetical protein